MLLGIFIGAFVGVVVGALLVILFSKNNKNHISAARTDILNAVQDVKNVVDPAKKS